MKPRTIFIPEKTTVTDITDPKPRDFVSPKGVKVKAHTRLRGYIYYYFGKKLFRVREHLVHLISVLFLLLIVSGAEACSRDINELKPMLQEKFSMLKEAANAEGIDFKIICGHRTQKEQNRLYAKGRTVTGKKVTWTRRSKHTKRIAFDIAVVEGSGISWEPETYILIGRIGQSLGLTWGGDWKVRDYGHFEL